MKKKKEWRRFPAAQSASNSGSSADPAKTRAKDCPWELCGHVRVSSRVTATGGTKRFVLPFVPHETWPDDGYSTMNRALCLTGGSSHYKTPEQGTAIHGLPADRCEGELQLRSVGLGDIQRGVFGSELSEASYPKKKRAKCIQIVVVARTGLRATGRR